MEKNDKNEPQTQRYHKLGALDEVLKNKTVLIADDDIREHLLAHEGIGKIPVNVVAAVDVKDALKKLQATPKVDMIDGHDDARMDGYETTIAIRKERNTRILRSSRYRQKPWLATAKSVWTRSFDYITKPVDVDQLFSLLRVWLYESRKR